MNAETKTLVRPGMDASGYVAGARQIEQANQRIAASGDAVVRSAERVKAAEAGSAQQSVRVSEAATQGVNNRRTAIQRLEETLDRTIAQQRRFEAAERTANSAVERGLRTRAEADATIARAREHFIGGTAATETATKSFGTAIQSVGLQVGDFATQVAGGGSAVTAMAQQLPQLLGAFGAFGAVAGAAVAILGAVFNSLGATKTEAERFRDTMDSVNDKYQDSIDRADRMQQVLERLGMQYASSNVQAAAFRGGLQEEAANLVRLTDYYRRLSGAQRSVALRANQNDTVDVRARGQAILNEGSGPLGGVASILSGQRSPLAAADSPFADTTVPNFSAQLVQAVEAERQFREQGVLTVDTVSQLVVTLRSLNTGTGESARTIERSASAWEAAIPRVQEYEAALRRLGITQQAIRDNNPDQLALERGRTAAGDVGGNYQTRQRLLRQRQDLQGLLNAPGATPEDRLAARSSLQSVAQQMVGLTPAVENYLRSLRQQAEVSQYAAGAARDLAQAEQQAHEAARGDGRGRASPAEVAEARRLTQARLNEALGETTDTINREITGQLDLASAYQVGGDAVDRATARQRAHNEALQFGGRTTDEYTEAVRKLEEKYLLLAQAQRLASDSRELAQQGRTIEAIRAEAGVVGWSAGDRAQQVAAIRERQRILSEEGDPESETGAQRIANARTIAQLDQDAQDVADVARGMGQAFSTAFQTAMEGGAGLSDILKQLERDLLRLGTQKLISEPLIGAFGGVLNMVSKGAGGGGGGGLLSSLLGAFSGGGGGDAVAAVAPVLHDGGMIGAGGHPMRSIAASVFSGAPRFHGGGWPGMDLGPDEVPVIAQRGERILSRDEVRRGTGGRAVIVNIQTPNPNAFRESSAQWSGGITRAVARGQRNT